MKTFVEYVMEFDGQTEQEAKQFLLGLVLSPHHSGDCTKESHACHLCVLESLLQDYRDDVFQESKK